MSEIYDALKQRTLDRKKPRLNSVVTSTEEHSGEIGPNANTSETIREAEPRVKPKLVPEGPPVFDLESADARIKVVLEADSVVGEQYRLLRAKLAALQRQQALKTLLVTSAVVHEGKTFTACCLAGVLAQEPGKRVLLIDADLRKPEAWRSLGLKAPDSLGGLSKVLRGELRIEAAIMKCASMELYFLPAGRGHRNASELLSSHVLESALRTAGELFDWIVIDCPPILPVADPDLLARCCDAALLVVHANRTPSELVKKAIERIGRHKFCGVVLNHVQRLKGSPYYYSYYRQEG